MKEKKWFEVDNLSDFDTPQLLLYPDRIKENIKQLIQRVDARNLRPHVKTNKIAEVCGMMLSDGIHKFKAATIAEAEMLAIIKAPDVLLAYPPGLEKIRRLIRLIQKYPDTSFSCLADDAAGVKLLSDVFAASNLTARIFIDLNLGMNRTGIVPGQVPALYSKIKNFASILVMGLHVYDGHIRDQDPVVRALRCNQVFEPVIELKKELEKLTGRPMTLIAGGSPTSLIHAAAGGRECSPGTFIFWDKGYADLLTEQPFQWAAVLACRIISKPAPGKICVDLGYKSVASENPLPRVYFLNAPDAIPAAQSEEHLVLDVPDSFPFKTGDVLYGVPYHICPSVALYDNALIVENHLITGNWEVVARKRSITI